VDTATLDYRTAQKVKLPALDMARNIEDTRERLKSLVWSEDRVGAFLWKTLSRTLCYTRIAFPKSQTRWSKSIARCAGVSIGNWTIRSWDAIGVEKSVAKFKRGRQAGSGECAGHARRRRKSFTNRKMAGSSITISLLRSTGRSLTRPAQ